MIASALLASWLLVGVSPAEIPRIRQVEVSGNLRVPAESILHQVSAAPGLQFDAAQAESDIKKLHRLGYFHTVEVHCRDAGAGLVDVAYRVRERPLVSLFMIEGTSESLGELITRFLIKEKLEIRRAVPFDPALAQKAALAVRLYLNTRKYPEAETHILTRGQGVAVQVVLQVKTGPRLQVGRVLFSGNQELGQDELAREMKLTRAAPFWARWLGEGRYVKEELASDLDRARRLYQSRGFAEASLGEPEVRVCSQRAAGWGPAAILLGMKPMLQLRIPVFEGPRYELASVEVQGDARSASPEVTRLAKSLHTPTTYNYALLEATRQKMLGSLGHAGYALARVQLRTSIDPAKRQVRAIYDIDAGDPLAIGRIDFRGNHRIPDRFLRRELRSREGEVYDTLKLDESIERLNRANLVREISRSDVRLEVNESNLLDITFHVKEKDRHGIYATGGTGGIGGGYLGIIYTAFNLLGLGEWLALELDGGASQSNVLLDMVGRRFLGSPFTVALSGFHRFTNLNVASIVPGPQDLVGVFRRRSTGIGISGAYPITTKAHVGLGYQLERESFWKGSGDQAATSAARSALTPSFALDATHGSGARVRGARLALSHSWYGSPLLQSINSTAVAAQLALYAPGPWSAGRNSLALHLEAGAARPHGEQPLALNRRLFPGAEVVRGFGRGGLSPWAFVPGVQSSPLQPAGADTLIGASAEYRVPLRGSLSGIAFVDLGWTQLDPRSAASMGKGARLLEETSGLLRASAGGELRLDLPVIRQPARLIFAWNPLRLEKVFEMPSNAIRMADPRRTLRFALGSRY